jgi:hypothetical protein
VGRDDEVARLRTHWGSLDTHASMEGNNGVGKTSPVAVAAYRAMVGHSLEEAQPMFLPLVEPFQMQAGDDLEEQVLFVIARSIIHYEDAFKAAGMSLPKIGDVRTWLDNPILRGGGGGASVLGIGASATYSQTANTGGFSKAGFRDTVKEWLREIFPTKDAGAFVGVIENLELLENSQEARRALEAMRDTVLALPGVKWVALRGQRNRSQFRREPATHRRNRRPHTRQATNRHRHPTRHSASNRGTQAPR